MTEFHASCSRCVGWFYIEEIRTIKLNSVIPKTDPFLKLLFFQKYPIKTVSFSVLFIYSLLRWFLEL